MNREVTKIQIEKFEKALREMERQLKVNVLGIRAIKSMLATLRKELDEES